MHKVLFMLGHDKAEESPGEDIASLCFIYEVYGVFRRSTSLT